MSQWLVPLLLLGKCIDITWYIRLIWFDYTQMPHFVTTSFGICTARLTLGPIDHFRCNESLHYFCSLVLPQYFHQMFVFNIHWHITKYAYETLIWSQWIDIHTAELTIGWWFHVSWIKKCLIMITGSMKIWHICISTYIAANTSKLYPTIGIKLHGFTEIMSVVNYKNIGMSVIDECK